VSRFRQTGTDWLLQVECEPRLLEGIILKGSIACDGVSLTVTALSDSGFEVNIIPFTYRHTALDDLQPGSLVNIETDLLGKYVRRVLETARERVSPLTHEKLRGAGFMPES
jgi:riboflavin synthase